MDTPGRPSAPTTPDPTTPEATDGKCGTTEPMRRRSSEPGIGSIVAAAWSLTLAKVLGLVFGAVLIATLLWNVVDDVIVGRPVVSSGSTLEIDGARIALWGARAPAIEDSCLLDGTRWACGAYSFAALYARIANRSVWCISKQRRHEVIAAQCFIGFTDLAQEMVERGWAEADVLATARYAGSETHSRRSRRGMWQVAASPETQVR